MFMVERYFLMDGREHGEVIGCQATLRFTEFGKVICKILMLGTESA